MTTQNIAYGTWAAMTVTNLQSRIDDVNHSIGVLWGVDEDEDEELLWLML